MMLTFNLSTGLQNFSSKNLCLACTRSTIEVHKILCDTYDQGGSAIDTPPDTFSTAFDPPTGGSGGDFHLKPFAH